MIPNLIAGFDWDEGNRQKCQKHGVSIEAIESLFTSPLALFPDATHSSAEERLKAIGRLPDGASVLVVFTFRQRPSGTFIRPISARYMHRTEIEHYEKAASSPEQ